MKQEPVETERLRADLTAAIAAKEALARELETTLNELHDAKLKLSTVATSTEGVWRWQGDGCDNPASLSCPVVMSAETLRGIIAAKEAAERQIQAKDNRIDDDTTTINRLRVEIARADGAAFTAMAEATKFEIERDRLAVELAEAKGRADERNAQCGVLAKELSAAVARAEVAEKENEERHRRMLQDIDELNRMRPVLDAARKWDANPNAFTAGLLRRELRALDAAPVTTLRGPVVDKVGLLGMQLHGASTFDAELIRRSIAAWPEEEQFVSFPCAECGYATAEQRIPHCMRCGETYVPAALDNAAPTVVAPGGKDAGQSFDVIGSVYDTGPSRRELLDENNRLRAKCSRQRKELRRLNAKGHELRSIQEDALAHLRVAIAGYQTENAELKKRESPELAWRRSAAFFMTEAGERWQREHQCNGLLPPYQPPPKEQKK